MRFTPEEIRACVDGQYFNWSGNEPFTFVNIAIPTGSLAESIDYSRQLFCLVHETSPEKEGWYESPFDRREYDLSKLFSEFPNSALMTDSAAVRDKFKKTHALIFVSNVDASIRSLCDHVLTRVKPRIVAVTGSVGKTTAVAQSEKVLSRTNHVLRLYSKRITPLLLYSILVNWLEVKHDLVVAEFALSRKNHVGKLAQLLPPDTSVLLNVRSAHLGCQNIRTRRDILDGKKEIFTQSAVPILNIGDPAIATVQNSLCLRSPVTFSVDRRTPAELRIVPDGSNFAAISQGRHLVHFHPFIPTRLALEQASAAIAVGLTHRVPPPEIEQAIANFIPSENRLQSYRVFGKTIFFDGENSIVARLRELALHHSARSTLILTRLHYPWRLEFISTEMMSEVIPRFERVFLLDPEPRFGSWKGEGAISAAPSDLNTIIRNSTGYTVLHHGGYFKFDSPIRNSPTLPLVDRLLQLSDSSARISRD